MNAETAGSPIRPIEWIGGLDGSVRMIDQTLLPERLEYITAQDVEMVYAAIRALQVRGAPAIGIAAAMGLVLAVRDVATRDRAEFAVRVQQAVEYLAGARPTAVNLRWALERLQAVLTTRPTAGVADLKERLLTEARAIRDEDAALCRAIGECGADLIRDGAGILTHCNAGGLATAELGTALAPIYLAHAAGRKVRVYADETRPLLQGARLTAWELHQAGIEVVVICDNMAGVVLRDGLVDLVITGADRIAANGDVANKIGTYGLAVLAAAHHVPFYVAAPYSTFDLACPSGADIPIEYRSDAEVRHGFGRTTVPAEVACWCPAFDVTPARLIAGLITDRGLIRPVDPAAIAVRMSRE